MNKIINLIWNLWRNKIKVILACKRYIFSSNFSDFIGNKNFDLWGGKYGYYSNRHDLWLKTLKYWLFSYTKL